MSEVKNDHITSENSSLTFSPLNSNILEGQKRLNASFDDKLAISDFYHISEIEQNGKINQTARHIIWVGFIVIVIGIISAFCGRLDIAKIAVVSGTITEFISGCVLALLTQSNKNKLKYFEQISFNEECCMYINEIRQLDDEEEKNNKLNMIIQNYCDRRK